MASTPTTATPTGLALRSLPALTWQRLLRLAKAVQRRFERSSLLFQQRLNLGLLRVGESKLPVKSFERQAGGAWRRSELASSLRRPKPRTGALRRAPTVARRTISPAISPMGETLSASPERATMPGMPQMTLEGSS